MEVVLYTTECPKCKVLEKKLSLKNIRFKTVKGEENILNLGYQEAPLLCVDGHILTFVDANRWINEQGVTR